MKKKERTVGNANGSRRIHKDLRRGKTREETREKETEAGNVEKGNQSRHTRKELYERPIMINDLRNVTDIIGRTPSSGYKVEISRFLVSISLSFSLFLSLSF